MKLYRITHPFYNSQDERHMGEHWFRTWFETRRAVHDIKARYLRQGIRQEHRVPVVIDRVDIGKLNTTLVLNIINREDFVVSATTLT